MVKKDKLKIGDEYYVPTYGSAVKVTLLSINDGFAEIEACNGQVFHRKLKYLFKDLKTANRSRRTWEHGRRKANRRKDWRDKQSTTQKLNI